MQQEHTLGLIKPYFRLMSVLFSVFQKARAAKRKQQPAPQVPSIGDEFKQQQYWEKETEPEESCGVTVDEITYAYHSPLHFRTGEEPT